MATTRPFAYNTGSTIDGTTQIGNIAIGVSDQDYSQNPGGVKWWMGPDEDLGYVIANVVQTGDHPTPVDVDSYINFWRSTDLTNQSLLDLLNVLPITDGVPPFGNVNDAKTWLNSNGHFTSYGEGAPPPTPTPTPTPTAGAATSTPTTAPTDTPTPTTVSTSTPTPLPATSTPTPAPTSAPTDTPVPATSTPLPATSTPTPTPTTVGSCSGVPYNLTNIFAPPTSGNAMWISNATPSNVSNLVNTLAIANPAYFNKIDNDGTDRTSYFNNFTGSTFTMTVCQNGNSATYSGISGAIAYDNGTNSFIIDGVKLSLVQSSPVSAFTFNELVYIDLSNGSQPTATPVPTGVPTDTPTPTPTPTPI